MSTAAGQARPRQSPTLPAPSHRRELRAVPRRRAIPRLPFVLLTVLVIVGGVLGLLALNVSVNQQAFEIARLDKANRQAEARYSVLQAEVDRLKSPARIARAAKARGMVPAGQVRVATWPGGKPGRAASPGEATSPVSPGDPTIAGRDPTWPDGVAFPLKQHLADP